MLKKVIIQVSIIVLIISMAVVSQAKRASIAVFPFYFQKDFNNVLILDTTTETTSSANNEIVKSTIGVKSRLELIGLTDKLITELVGSRKFDLLERSRMDEIMNEHDFSNAKGMIDPSRIVQSAKMIAADYLIIGSVSVMNHEISYKTIPYINKIQESEQSQLIVDFRIIETSTGQIVSSNDVEVKSIKTNQVRKRRQNTQMSKETFDRLSRKLSKKIVLDVIDAIYPIKIAAYENGIIFLNRGQGSGIKKGDKFTVYVQGKELRDPDTGLLLGNNESTAGAIIVSDVLPKFSKATPQDDNQVFEVGSICRKEVHKRQQDTINSKADHRHVKPQW